MSMQGRRIPGEAGSGNGSGDRTSALKRTLKPTRAGSERFRPPGGSHHGNTSKARPATAKVMEGATKTTESLPRRLLEHVFFN
jgi:hypothetical protein